MPTGLEGVVVTHFGRHPDFQFLEPKPLTCKMEDEGVTLSDLFKKQPGCILKSMVEAATAQ